MSKPSRVGWLVYKARELCNGDSMMLVIIGDEGDEFVAIDKASAEKVDPEFDHGIVIVRVEDNVREFARADDLGAGLFRNSGHDLVQMALGVSKTREADYRSGRKHILAGINTHLRPGLVESYICNCGNGARGSIGIPTPKDPRQVPYRPPFC